MRREWNYLTWTNKTNSHSKATRIHAVFVYAPLNEPLDDITRCKARVSRQCQAEIKWENSSSHNTIQPTSCLINNIFETSGRCQLNDEAALIQRTWSPLQHSERKNINLGHCGKGASATTNIGLSGVKFWVIWSNGGLFEVVDFQLKASVVALLGEVRSCSYSWFPWEVLGRQLREVCLNRLCKHVPQPCYLWRKGKLTQLFTWVAGYGCPILRGGWTCQHLLSQTCVQSVEKYLDSAILLKICSFSNLCTACFLPACWAHFNLTWLLSDFS